MNENLKHNQEMESESLERELNSAPEWTRFGHILTAAHEAVYREPAVQSISPRKPRHFGKALVFLSTAALVLIALTIGLFYGNGPLGNRSANDFLDPELDWEEGELDLELFDEQLEQIAMDDSSVELEYAVLFNSLSEWDEEFEEEELF